MGMNGPGWGRQNAARKGKEAGDLVRQRAQQKRSITLTVAPFGRGWSVKESGAYYGEYPTQTQARAGAETWAAELRHEGHDVTIMSTTKKPGGR